MNPSTLVYDCEIVRCIPPNDPAMRSSDLEYAEGWTDFKGMQISTICVYDYLSKNYRVFLEDNFGEFADLAASRDEIIGFNSLAFDDLLCAAHGIKVRTTYDLLCEVRAASGQPREYVYGRTRRGYSLEALARANLGIGKSGSGALAPELWQRGKRGAVIDYALLDVQLTRRLFELGMGDGLIDPTGLGMLTLREPEGWA